jgi:hypothetical protein
MPEGTTLERTSAVTKEIAQYLTTVPEVVNYQNYIGASAPITFNGLVRHYDMRGGSNMADIQVNLLNKKDRKMQSHDIAKKVRPHIQEIAKKYGANVKIVEVPPGPPVLSTIVAEIYGPDHKEQIKVAYQVKEILENTDDVVSLYHSMQLEGVVNWRAFKQAVTGYNRIKNRKRDVLTLIDFSKPSTEKRLYVFDMKHRRMLYSSVVSHGKNSGGNYATSFSNEYGSYKSSLGFYLTASTYQGRNGYSLILDGLEKGINDRARERAIVVHGASYADPSVASRGGRLGRSFGCPALPTSVSRPIIDAIKGGSVMYIYAETPSYLAQSSILDTSDDVIVNQ